MVMVMVVVIILHCVSKKVPTFKLSVTLSNLNRFSKFCTTGKRMKFATKPLRSTHLTLGMLLHYLGKLKIQIFLQIFSRYGRKCTQVAFLSPLTLLLIYKC